jgi:hypothetical protein
VRRALLTGATQETYFDLSQDLPALEKAICNEPNCRMVVIGPLTAYFGDTDSHKNAEVRAVLAKLFDLAARLKVAVLAITHLNKAGGLPAIYRAMGSLAFVAASRAVWAVVRDENARPGPRGLTMTWCATRSASGRRWPVGPSTPTKRLRAWSTSSVWPR